MERSQLGLAAILSLGISLNPLAYAEKSSDGPSHREGFQQKRKDWDNKKQEIFNQLQLSDEQKKQLEENRAKNKDKRKNRFEGMRSKRDALNQEFMKSELDMDQIQKIQGEIKAEQSEMADQRLNSVLEVRKILTPEQFKKFNELMDQRRQERGWDKQKDEE